MTLTDWIQIFKTGTHTDGAGVTHNWTEADLDTIVSKFNPAQHEPPVVIGHPQMDSPAYGWVAGLKREGEFLLAQLKDLVPDFVDMVNQGLFKKRSMALYPDLTLRHVGFLGAAPPAVRGLADVKFAIGAFAEVSFESTTGSEHITKEGVMDESKLKVMFKEFLEGVKELIGKKTPEAGDRTAEFAEKDKALSARETALQQKEHAATKSLAETARITKAAGIHAFCEGLKAKGHLVPAWQKMGIEKFLMELPSEGAYQFAEGDGKATQTPLAFMQAFLTELPKVIEFTELAKRTEAGADQAVDAKAWAKDTFAKGKDVYTRLNVTEAMLEKIAPTA